MLTFPSIEDVAWELRALNSSSDGKTVVYLQVFSDGKWWIHNEHSSVNTDEKCYQARTEVPGCTSKRNKPRKFDSEEVARQLIESVRQQCENDGDVD